MELALLADPVFDAEDPRVRAALRAKNTGAAPATVALASSDGAATDAGPLAAGADTDRATLGRLLGSRREAAAILDLVPPALATASLDFAASRARATSGELARYRIVHFATHGVLDDVHPELSAVVLSLVDETGAEQDGFLRLHDVQRLELAADLVVLSACQTGLGKEVRGEGLLGLNRAFMNAGATRVVSTLWKVDDRASAELMRRFYAGLLGPRRLAPAAALRAAQLSLAAEARWESPFYWAGFVLQGEWN
jgi:CHAT domain-containing protein